MEAVAGCSVSRSTFITRHLPKNNADSAVVQVKSLRATVRAALVGVSLWFQHQPPSARGVMDQADNSPATAMLAEAADGKCGLVD